MAGHVKDLSNHLFCESGPSELCPNPIRNNSVITYFFLEVRTLLKMDDVGEATLHFVRALVICYPLCENTFNFKFQKVKNNNIMDLLV